MDIYKSNFCKIFKGGYERMMEYKYKKEEEVLGRPLTNFEKAFIDLDKKPMEPVLLVKIDGKFEWVKESSIKNSKAAK